MERLGTYTNIVCYRCTEDEYDKMSERQKMENYIYIMTDGTMVKKNIIVGYYDGASVKDNYSGELFRKPKRKVEPVAAMEPKTAETLSTTGCEELKVPEIDFKNYSRVVDDFFASLLEDK